MSICYLEIYSMAFKREYREFHNFDPSWAPLGFSKCFDRFYRVAFSKKCESQLDWQVRCTLPKQLERMDTQVNCPKTVWKKCVLQMWNCISVWDWHTVVFMIISNSASRANLIDWCARSWAGIPRFALIFMYWIFFWERICKDFQLCISKKNPHLWQVQVCGSPVAHCTYWAPLSSGRTWFHGATPYKDQPKGTLAFQSVSAQVSWSIYSKLFFPILIIKLKHNSAKTLWIFDMKTKWACNAPGPFDKGPLYSIFII